MSWDLDSRLLHFDLELEANSWFILAFGELDTTEHDMIKWKVESQAAETEDGETQFITSVEDSLWLGFDIS